MSRTLPTQAVILAAGLATRLRPLTWRMPKACLPVWGRPALHHVLSLLESWGVREALINLHHEPLTVLETAQAWPGRLRLNFSFEPLQPLGTGGALRNGAWFLRDRPFWLVNADVMADLDPAPLLRAFHGPARPLAALWMVPDAGPRTVLLKDGFVSDFATTTHGAPGTATFSGLHLVRPDVLRHLPEEPFSSIITGYRRALAAGCRIAGVVVPDSYWEDIGTLPEYLGAHAAIEAAWKSGARGGRLYDPAAPAKARALRRSGVHVEGFVSIAAGVEAGPGARLRNCVLWRAARIAPDARVENAVVAEGVRVHGEVTGMAVRADVLPEAGPFLAAHGWPPAETAALPLGPRGSDRAFFRLQHAGKSAILIEYGRERHENTLYAGHTRFLLENGIRVPHLLGQDARRRLLILEDAGRRDLLAVLEGADEARRLELYRPVLDLAARLHTDGTRAAREAKLRLVAGFSPKLYRWERLYFVHHFLQNRLKLSPRLTTPIAADLRRLAARLEPLPRVLIHRDLQSTNVILTPAGPLLIDYQGMRYGAAAYDLASLLADPYVSLSPREQALLLEDYRQKSGTDLPDELFWTAAVQRLAQALGAYAKLGANPGTASFARHIPPALAMMKRAVGQLKGNPVPHLSSLLDSLVN
jgi:NDP-sugar pyrophosphorylase family protein/aminoglycoside/choline kinase family phosphotransferase